MLTMTGRRKLFSIVTHEMERIGTLDQQEVELRAFAKARHNEAERALCTASGLEPRRTYARDAGRQVAIISPHPDLHPTSRGGGTRGGHEIEVQVPGERKFEIGHAPIPFKLSPFE